MPDKDPAEITNTDRLENARKLETTLRMKVMRQSNTLHASEKELLSIRDYIATLEKAIKR